MNPDRIESTARPILDIKPRGEALPFPEDPNVRFEAIFAAIGNSEAKCLTLLNLEDYPMTKGSLHSEFVRSSNGAWNSNRNNQARYCTESLAPIGLVAQADTLFYGSSEYVTGYRLTPAGKEIGQPIAAFIMKQSLEFDHTLNEIFGGTNKGSGQTRSVLNRTQILQLLYEDFLKGRKYSTVSEMEKTMGVNNSVISLHLPHLAKLGLVEYSSLASGSKKNMQYEATESTGTTQVGPIRGFDSIAQTAADILSEKGSIDAEEMFAQLSAAFPEFKLTQDKVFHILSVLKEQGFATSYFGTGEKSRAKITEAGQKLVKELIIPVQQAVGPDGKALIDEWRQIPWKEIAPKAIARYKETSGHVNFKPVQEWASDLLQIIMDNPGSRPSDLKKILNRETSDILPTLLREGLVRKEVTGSAVRYYPT